MSVPSVVGRLTASRFAGRAATAGWRSRRGVRLGLALAVLILALGLRVGQVERTTPYQPMNDAQSYLALARDIAHSGDYRISHAVGSGAGGSIGPTAYFPPAFPYFLAAVDLIDGDTTSGGQAVQAARLSTAVLGAGAVALLGLVALEAFGEVVALVAMLIAAIYPPLIELSATPYSENLLIVLELAAVWAVLRALRAANPLPPIVAAGVLVGLATLTHQNGLVILLPLIFAAAAMGRSWAQRPTEEEQSSRQRWIKTVAVPAALVAATVLAIAPWTIRNAIVLHRFIPVSDETGATLAGTYNPTAAADRAVPYRWIWYGVVPADAPIARATHTLTEPSVSSQLTSAAFSYIGDHPLAPLQAAYHNLRRLLELEGSAAWRDSASSIGVPTGNARIGVFAFWMVALLALAGVITRAARRAPQWLWAIPILLAWSVVLVNAETPRFRSPIDPYLIMLAACAVVAAAERLRALISARHPVPADGNPAPAPSNPAPA